VHKYARIDAAFDRFSHSVALLGMDIARADALEIPNDGRRDEAAKIKAVTYVLLAAALERFVQDMLSGLFEEIDTRGVLMNQLRPSMRATLLTPLVQSVRDTSGLKGLERACELLEIAVSNSPLVLNDAVYLLDGRTIRSGHFLTIWRVLGMAGSHLYSKQYGHLALEDLADGRNEIAHGVEDPITFGRAKVCIEVKSLLEHIENQALHFVLMTDAYLDSQQYLTLP
jgi:hypothetical protein